MSFITKLNEKGVDEFSEMHNQFGYDYAVSEIIKFLKDECGLSNIHSIVCKVRKEFLYKKFFIKDSYGNSNFQEELMKSLDDENMDN